MNCPQCKSELEVVRRFDVIPPSLFDRCKCGHIQPHEESAQSSKPPGDEEDTKLSSRRLTRRQRRLTAEE